MVAVLVSLLVAIIVTGLTYGVVVLLPLPAPFKQVALAACLLILLVWTLSILGFVGPPWRVPVR